jgi:hypothetical protein
MEDKKRIAVRNKDGEEIGVVYCPTDAAALNRCVEGMARFKKATALLVRININPDGTTDKSGMFIIQNAEKKIYELFDYILGYEGASKPLFAVVRPFARVKGKFYCEHCLDAVRKYIDTQEVKSHGEKG